MILERNQYKKLYWCNTFDYMHAGFLVATNIRQARKIYGKHHYCYIKDVDAKMVLRLPICLQQTIESFPSDTLLQACGCQLVNVNCPGTRLVHVVRLMLKPGGRIWSCPNTNLVVQEK
jgi:hypothetical protein